MQDRILETFLEHQQESAMELVAHSDVLRLEPLGPSPHRRYVAHFGCRGLVRTDSRIQEHQGFVVGIRFPELYLREVEPLEIVTMLAPTNVFHPNVARTVLCPGHIVPGTPLVDILYQSYEILSGHKFNLLDVLCQDAVPWYREHADRFPIDRTPLRRSSRASTRASREATS